MTQVSNFLLFVCHLFLWNGLIVAFFYLFGKHSFIKLSLKRICRDFEIDVSHNSKMHIQIQSQPWPLLESNDWISLLKVSVLKSIVIVKAGNSSYSFHDLIVRKEAAICDRSTFFSEKRMKQVWFDKKSDTDSLFTRKNDINKIFEQLTAFFF